MKTKILLSLLLSASSLASFCRVWTISNSGFTFTNSTLVINYGDTINFVLSSSHNAVEVTQATWNANNNSPIVGGFEVSFGGGIILPTQLSVGTHYYVCSPHASLGMKGTIKVESTTGIIENQNLQNSSIYPNPTTDIINIKTSDDLQNSTYMIINHKGENILYGKLNDEISIVDISCLPNGVYLLQLGQPKRQVYKVIKK